MMEHPLKIISWNINGIRSQKNNFKQLLDSLEADIICLQETKVTRDLLEEAVAVVDGYLSFFSFSRKRTGYSGVATFCKTKVSPVFAQEGLTGCLKNEPLDNLNGSFGALPGIWDPKELKELDSEGRCIITIHSFQNARGEKKMLAIINVYCPRADPEKPERAAFKLAFYKLLHERAFALRKSGFHVIIVGDINTAHRRIDRCDSSDVNEDFDLCADRHFLNNFIMDTPTNMQSDSCVDSEDVKSEMMPQLFKVVDTFRSFHPHQQDAFTCWNTKANARASNFGSRIDYIFCDKDFLKFITDASIHTDVFGSDHCPVSVRLRELHWLPSSSIPLICTKFFSEFLGTQQKLSSYFMPVTEGSKPLISINSKTGGGTIRSRQTPPSKRKKRIKGLPRNYKKSNVESNRIQSTLNSFFIKENFPNSDINFKSSHDGNSACNLGSLEFAYSVPSGKCENTPTELSRDPIAPNGSSNLTTSLKIPSDSTCQRLSNPEEMAKPCNSKKSAWNFLMEGAAPLPLCSGHKEPSVLKKVKKRGLNLNKEFYCCARGLGKEGDPNAACKFFQWVGKKPK